MEAILSSEPAQWDGRFPVKLESITECRTVELTTVIKDSEKSECAMF